MQHHLVANSPSYTAGTCVTCNAAHNTPASPADHHQQQQTPYLAAATYIWFWFWYWFTTSYHIT